jgi:hypothetical protein
MTNGLIKRCYNFEPFGPPIAAKKTVVVNGLLLNCHSVCLMKVAAVLMELTWIPLTRDVLNNFAAKAASYLL